MATKNEKLVGLILGAGIGGFVAYNKQIDQDLQQKKHK